MFIRFARKHAIIPFAIFGATIIALLSHSIHAAKDDIRISLRDMEGDRSALQDVVLEGILGDGFHETAFEISGGKLSSRTKIYEDAKPVRSYYLPGKLISSGFPIDSIQARDFIYSVIDEPFSFNRISIGKYDLQQRMIGSSKLKLNISSTAGNTYSNTPNYGLAVIGGKAYFTPLVTLDYSGTSGIYETLGFFNGGDEERPDEESRLLASLDLEGNNSYKGTGLEVLGLEAVGNKLALIAARNGEVIVQGYDSESGELLGEAAVGEYVRGGSKDSEAGSAIARGVNEQYHADVDMDSQMINLSFRTSESTQEEWVQAVASVSLADGVELLNKQDVRIKGRFSSDRDFTMYSYRNGKLYLAMSKVIDEEAGDLGHPTSGLAARSLTIRVYEGGKQMYIGELATDMNEDFIEDYFMGQNQMNMHKGLSMYRLWKGLRFRDATDASSLE
ncbi:hypothetical protein [Paenibacillus sp. HB172176]|uniref:hypothetical protein n=1 Tax=Paenibacillus sp. HB172176 TaxID=2493690 RepID=UPI00143A3231|nr:hypothetical protein [Paenibacillus sp. HB172176]